MSATVLIEKKGMVPKRMPRMIWEALPKNEKNENDGWREVSEEPNLTQTQEFFPVPKEIASLSAKEGEGKRELAAQETQSKSGLQYSQDELEEYSQFKKFQKLKADYALLEEEPGEYKQIFESILKNCADQILVFFKESLSVDKANPAASIETAPAKTEIPAKSSVLSMQSTGSAVSTDGNPATGTAEPVKSDDPKAGKKTAPANPSKPV